MDFVSMGEKTMSEEQMLESLRNALSKTRLKKDRAEDYVFQAEVEEMYRFVHKQYKNCIYLGKDGQIYVEDDFASCGQNLIHWNESECINSNLGQIYRPIFEPLEEV